MANPYFTCELEAWREGSTLYGRMHYYRSGTYHYQDSSFPNPTMNLAGTTYEDSGFGNWVRSGIDVGDVRTTTYSRTIAGTGDRTVTFTAGSGMRSDFAGSWSKTVNFPPTSPTGLSCNNLVRGVEEFTANVSLSGWGKGSGTRYRELQCWTYNESSLVEPRRYQPAYGDSLSGNITVSNGSSGNLTIVGNTMYTIGVYASNGEANTGSVRVGNYTTRAYAPTLSVNTLGENDVIIAYSTQADGGKYAKSVQYSIDGGTTWVTGATVNTGSATTGTFTISGLTDDTEYTIKCRVSTSSGETNGTDITFRTLESHKLYGSVGGVTKKVTKLYGSVGGQTKEIKKLYASVGGVTKRVF